MPGSVPSATSGLHIKRILLAILLLSTWIVSDASPDIHVREEQKEVKRRLGSDLGSTEEHLVRDRRHALRQGGYRVYGKDQRCVCPRGPPGPQGRPGITPQAKYMLATAQPESEHITVGDHIKFNLELAKSGDSITLFTDAASYGTVNDQPTIGRFLLKGAETYELSANLGYMEGKDEYEFYMVFQWYIAEGDGRYIGAKGSFQSWHYTHGFGAQALAYLSPIQDTLVELRIIVAVDVTAIGHMMYGLPRAIIKVVR